MDKKRNVHHLLNYDIVKYKHVINISVNEWIDRPRVPVIRYTILHIPSADIPHLSSLNFGTPTLDMGIE